MVTLVRAAAASSLAYIPKQLLQHHKLPPPPPPPPPPPSQPPFIPFSQLQHQHQHQHQRRLLENHLIYTLDSCTSVSQAQQIHAHILLKGVHQSCYVLTKLVRTLTKFNVPIDPYPRSIFDHVRYPNPFLYTALIRGYSYQGQIMDCVKFYTLMRDNDIDPVSFTFTALFKACGASKNVFLGRQFHCQVILVGGFGKDLFVGNSTIDMYIKCGVLECGRKVFDEMPTRDAISWTELIVAYANHGDMSKAIELFDELPLKDMVAWTAMVNGFAQNAQPREAIEYFERMLSFGVQTDMVTLIGIISACAQLGVVKYADWIRDVADKSGFCGSYNVVVGSALIDMYSKCGSVKDAYRVFAAMKERNVYSYSSMIMGFAMHGCAHDALKLFNEMEKTEIKPNEVTLIGVLTACCHVGMVEQGRYIFESMDKLYGVKPSTGHYACMANLFGRAGKLEEALELAKTMAVQNNAVVWGALLGACRIHGNPEIAAIAANRLFELEPYSIGNYVLLCNIYGAAGRWDDVMRVRKLMRVKGLKKNPGCSWFETEEGVVHEFFAGDMTHPRSSEIKDALEDLLNRLEADGYQPNLSCVPYNMSDKEKRRILMTHSEKLALAFGLICTDPGSPLRIMKNLRMCEDCHLVMCGASRVMGRDIVVRDNMRFHHFSDGRCSCGDFW